MQKPLASEDINQRLIALNSSATGGKSSWTLVNGKLSRNYRFADFVTAFGFMTEAAILAERANHHPEWQNVYGRVDVQLTTHDAGGLTDRDFDLAAAMERIARQRSS